MDFLSLLATAITEIFKCLIPSLKRQIAYSVHCERKLKKLKQKVEELETTRNDVQRRIDIAKRALQSIRRVVEKWLERVEKESTTARELETIVGLECFRGWCSCGSGSRYDLGRKAEKKMVIIDELLIEGKNFNVVSDPSPPLLSLPTNQDFEVFASREPIRAEVMAALKDERTTLIGVYGMGGVGKTTLMTQVGKQAKEENLFDEVVMTSVSQNIDLKRLQNEIAEQLGLERLKDMECTSARAALLSKRLKQENRVLVILDDLWSTNLNLSDVGIPCGEKHHHKGCKVIITTRSRDVCNSQRSQKYIDVAVLSEEESWNLFKKNVGDDKDFPILQTAVAKEVARECGGLPVALVTLGRSLRNKDDKFVWDDAALQLKRSTFHRFDEGMNSAVFTSIKLSYDYLRYEMIKKCFLFCCLFPEDRQIQVHELMVYAMGDDEILEDSETLIQASGRLHAILDKLVASCLLLGYKDDRGNYAVRMHDIIRDVAISIASEEGNGFCVKAGVMGLTEWPKTIGLLPSNSTTCSTGKCLRLSLMENKISVLPEEPPELPHLLSLSLNGNGYLKKIPDNFFARMPSLATLDLRDTCISSLPSSVSFLVNLRTLYLDNCSFLNDQSPLDISLTGKLKRLVVLGLESCNLERLPEEIRGLTNLKALNLSWNSNLEIIPPNVISSLSRLEYLNLEGCSKIRWGDIVDDKSGNIGSNASLAEVASLPCLTNLTLKTSLHGCTVRFEIMISDGLHYMLTGRLPLIVNVCCLRVSSSHPAVCDSIKVLMQRVRRRSVDLDRCIGLSSLGQLLVQDGGGACFNNMTELCIEKCDDMEYLMSVAPKDQEITSRIATFVALERLTIRSMNKLRDIFYGTIPIGFLDSLKFMRVQGCEEMVSVLGPNLVKMIPNLEELKVFDCGKLKDVFNLETTGSSSSMSLISVEKEISSSSSSTAVTLFSRLILLVLDGLSSLETVWKGSLEVPFRFHENLKEMEVSFCGKLRCLFSQSMARNLQQLERLKVFRCKSLVKLVTSDDDEDVQMAVVEEDDDQNVLFPNLKSLYIRRCQSLEQLWDDGGQENSSSSTSSSTILDCPYLEVLTVLRCENLKMRIRLTHRCATQLRWITGDSEDWFQGLEWEDPSDKLHVQPLFKAIDDD